MAVMTKKLKQILMKPEDFNDNSTPATQYLLHRVKQGEERLAKLQKRMAKLEQLLQDAIYED